MLPSVELRGGALPHCLPPLSFLTTSPCWPFLTAVVVVVLRGVRSRDGCHGRQRKECPAAASGQQCQHRPPRPQQWSNSSGQIIVLPLPRDVRNWVVPPPPAPPPVDVCGPGVHPPRAPACCMRPPCMCGCPRCPPRCSHAERLWRAAPQRMPRRCWRAVMVTPSSPPPTTGQ